MSKRQIRKNSPSFPNLDGECRIPHTTITFSWVFGRNMFPLFINVQLPDSLEVVGTDETVVLYVKV